VRRHEGPTARSSSDGQRSTQLGCAFSHGVQPKAPVSGAGYASAVIADGDGKILRQLQGHPAVARSGVTGHVGQRFSDDSIGGNFDGRRQWRESPWGLDLYGQPGLDRKVAGLGAQGIYESEVVEGRRPQVPGNAPDLGNLLPSVLLQLRQDLGRAFRLRINCSPGCLKL
jgi:hypothetical protein